jgi:glucan phosphoethanolaminetransferase (alkaline phosphatase superfamily)
MARLVFVMSGSESQLLLLVPAAATFVGMFGAFLVFIGSISLRERNRLFVISSGAFGALIGVIMPTSLVLGILITLSIADTILILNKSMQKTFGETKYEELLEQLTFSTNEWGIGIGDLICYSIITANTSVHYGIYAGALALVLILVGSYITIKAATKHSRFPGLAIPIALGLLPSITLLLLS